MPVACLRITSPCASHSTIRSAMGGVAWKYGFEMMILWLSGVWRPLLYQFHESSGGLFC